MLVTLVALGGYLYWRLDDEVRRYAENLLSQHYAHLDVSLGSARFEAGRGVTLRNLVINQPSAHGDPLSLVEVDEVQLLGAFDWKALASGKPAVDQVRIRSPRVHAMHSASGGWNVATLFPPPTTGNRPADVEVVGAVLLISDEHCNVAKPLTLREVGLTAKCIEQEPAADPDAMPSRTYEIEASVGGDVAEEFAVSATIQTGTGAIDGTLDVVGLDLSAPLVDSMLRATPQLAKVTQIDGKADISLVAKRPAKGDPIWTANFRVTDARIGIDGMPRPISNIAVEGVATQQRLFVREAEAQFASAKVYAALDRRGWHDSAKLAVQARADHLNIDASLAELLPSSVQRAFDRFRPAGEVSATMAAQFDGHHWYPEVTIDCHDVSFTDKEKFDYRLTGGQGKLVIADRNDGRGPVLEIQQLAANVGNRKATINGSFSGLPGLGERRSASGERLPATGWLEVSGQRFAITDGLVDALDPKVRRVVDSLDAKGRVSVRWRFERTDPLGTPRTETDLKFHDARVQFEKFRYPLANIEGHAYERNGNWKFEDLVSRAPNAPRVVRAAGTCTKLADGSRTLDLSFVGEQVPLDDSLRLALSPAHQEAWAAIRPQSGRVNFSARVVHRLGVGTPPQLHLEINPLPKVVSIEPKSFPYHLKNLQGTIVVDNQHVTFHNLRGEHGPTVFETNGSWIPNRAGGWQLQFNNLHVDRLSADFDLKSAAPTAIGKVIEYLKPQGTFSIRNGTVWFSLDTRGSTNLRSEWNVWLGCQQNDLEVGIPLKSVSGVVRLSGRHDANVRFAAGRLDLDSVFWNGMQFTEVRGPMWIDMRECRLGQGATERINQINGKSDPLQRITTNFYGGDMALDAKVDLNSRAPYVINMAVDKCDLARMSTDYFGGSVDLSGTLSGQATINGIGQSIELLQGGGRMAIRNATMYELPVMARLLKVLRLREPDKTAFTGVDALFDIDGSNIRFEELNLLGDAVSLYGKGVATFDRQLDLVFHSTVGRNDFNVPLLRSMIGQASANLLLIKVTGPVENASVEREPLPAVNDFVEQLGGEGVATPRPTRSFWNRR